MKTIFTVFKDISKAKEAIDRLNQSGFDKYQMNSIVQESTAKSHFDINRQEIKVEDSESLGGRKVQGFEKLFAGQQSLDTVDAGRILAAGQGGTILGKAATSAPIRKVDNLKKALIDFGIPEDTAQKYQEGVAKGKLLFWIRSEDTDSPKITNIVKDYQGEDLVTI
ncbi:general stress protein [Chitinispirillales bacterium ANBcel5]|uniref:hypothetical protein n=1 Tax=Cellulosispirillum alkaliphilum TaxID=3039283 RepID=UPI002A572478|nr:general stress protein [Chitinispirillales bacterium ANBcel5]